MKPKGSVIKKPFIILSIAAISAVIFTSCSHVNVASQDYYREQHMRHGIVPLSSAISQKLSESSKLRGKMLYEKHCLSCHGKNGEGDGPLALKSDHKPANLRKLAKEVPNFKFFMSISQWQGDMPGWKEKFNETDREDLVAYIKSFK